LSDFIACHIVEILTQAAQNGIGKPKMPDAFVKESIRHFQFKKEMN
jgi:hypothetical protein